MKIQLEAIPSESGSSFHLMFNPKLSDLFFWHFHPEFELVYIVGSDGTRHVGNHISTFRGSDLVLIGSNIPHLNFDYGIKTEYKKVVVHIKKSLIEESFANVPELSSVSELFQNSHYGISFQGKIKDKIGERLFKLEGMNAFQQYLELIQIFKSLSITNDFEFLHEQKYTDVHDQKEQERLREIHAFIDQNYHRKIELGEVASLCHLSKEAFCRYFKKNKGITFVTFLNQYRVIQAKRLLLSGMRVGEACFDTGFESLSYFNRTFKKVTGENPSNFRKRYLEKSV